MVPVEHAREGMRLSIDTPEGERGASVVPMPFVDPSKATAKS